MQEPMLRKVEVCVGEGRSDDALAEGGRSIVNLFFLCATVTRALPIALALFEPTVVWLFRPDADHTVAHLAEVSEDALDAIHVSNSRGSPETIHRHDCRTHVKPPYLDRPL